MRLLTRYTAGHFFILLVASVLSLSTRAAITDPPSAPATNTTGSYTVSWDSSTSGLQEQYNGGDWTIAQHANRVTSKSFSGKAPGVWTYRKYTSLGSPFYGIIYSKTVSVIVASQPSVPTGLTASPSHSTNGTQSLSWPASTGTVTAYELERSINGGGYQRIYTGTGRSRSYSGLGDASYRYRVRACHTVSTFTTCSGFRYSSTVTVLHLPNTPSAISSPSATSNTQYTVTWSAPSGGGTPSRYQLQEQIGSGGWSTVQNTLSLSYTTTNKARGQTYHYRVAACNNSGCSAYRTGASTYVRYAAPVVNLSVNLGTVGSNTYDAGYYGQYTLSWSVSGVATTVELLNGNGTPIANVDGVANQEAFDQPDNMGPGNQTFTYKVRASNVDASTTSATLSVVVRPYPIPGAPNNFRLRGDVSESGHYTLAWERPPEFVTPDPTVNNFFRLQRDGDVLPTLAPSATQYTFTDGVYGQTYSHRLSACANDHEHCSGWTPGGALSVYIPYPAPSTPGAIEVDEEPVLTGNVSLSWAAAGGFVDTYILEQKRPGDGGWSPIQNTAATNANLQLSERGHYQYRVKACNDDACSAYTAIRPVIAAMVQPFDSGDLVDPLSDSRLVTTTAGTPSVSASGAALYRVPLTLPPAVGGMKPALAFEYNSQRGTGEMGMGWSLHGLSAIHRCAPSFATEGYRGAVPQTRAERLCLDGEKLVAINRAVPATDADYWSAGTEYRTERESFTKIVAYGVQGNGPQYFKVWRRNGTELEFGVTSDARLVLPGHSNVDTWGLNKGTDAYGNSYHVVYGGDRTQGEYFVSRIDYEPGTTVRFKYIDRAVDEGYYRADQPRSYRAGALMSISRLLDTVTTYINVESPSTPSDGTPVREYRFSYERGESTDRFRLARLTECGYDSTGTQAACARPTHFDWEPGDQGFEPPANLNIAGMEADANPIVVDLNNDSYEDFVWVKDGTWHVAKGALSGYTILDTGITRGTGSPGKAIPLRIDDRYGLIVATERGISDPPIILYHTVWDLVIFDLENISNSEVKFIMDPTSIPRFAGSLASTQSYLYATAIPGDFNGDGLEDFYLSHGAFTAHHSIYLRKNASWSETFSDNFTEQTFSFRNAEGIAIGMVGGHLSDYNQDGLQDVFARRPYASEAESNARTTLKSVGSEFVIDGDWIFPRGDGEVVLKPYRWTYKYSKKSSGFLYRHKTTAKKTIFGNTVYQNLRNGLFVDLNDDGLDDYVVRLTNDGESEGTWRIYQNLGGTFGPEIDTGISTGTYVNQLAFVLDYDRDGRPDFVAQRPDGSAWQVLLTTQAETYAGSGVYQPALKILNVDPFQGELGNLLNFDIINDQVPITTDINNDDIPDIIYNSAGTWKIMYGKRSQPDLMVRATDGLGVIAEFDYSALTGTYSNGEPIYVHENSGNSFPQIDETLGLTVVKAMRLSNGVGSGANAFNGQYFQYRGAKADMQGRGFLGFSTVTVTDERTGVETLTQYHQTFPYIGLVKRMVVRSDYGNGGVLAETTHTHASRSLHNGQTRFPYIASSITRRYDLHFVPGDAHAWQQVDNTYDAWGNLTAQRVAGGSNATEYQVDHTYTVSNDTAQWQLGFITEHKATYQGFDGALSKTVVNRFTRHSNTLDVATETRFADSPVWVATTYERDDVGNIIGVSTSAADIDGATAPERVLFNHTNYQANLYPRELRNGLGHMTHLTYDTRFGAVISTTDANNLVTQKHYNAWGQLTRIDRADGSHVAIHYAYCDEAGVECPPAAEYRVAAELLHSAQPGFQGTPRQWQYFDSLNRLVRSETAGFLGSGEQVIRVDREYNLRGLVAKETMPHADGDTSLATCEADGLCTTFAYDTLGRLIRVQQPDGGEAAYTYASHTRYPSHVHTEISVAAPDGTTIQQQDHYRDGVGRLVYTEDAYGMPVAYRYNAQGLLRETQLNDDGRTRVSMAYDIAGNKISLQDPDAGQVTYEYDGLGQLRRETQAPGTEDQVTSVQHYDVLGRLTSRVTPEGTHIWQYDTQKLGLLREVRGEGFVEQYTYDAFSRVQHIDTSLTGSSTRQYRFSHTYDAFSRPDTLTYPSGLAVRYRYRTTGYLGGLENAQTQQLYWAIRNTNEQGQPIEEMLGNGLLTEREFHPATGQLQRLRTNNGAYNAIQHLAYVFDSLGNLRERRSQREHRLGGTEENLAETFQYDALNRLVQATTTGLGGGDRTVDYNYDPLGNLTYKSDVGSYDYTQTNGAGIHAVTQAGSRSFQYDARGNMTLNGGTTLAYASFNKPVRIEGDVNIAFKYGPQQERFYQQSGARETYYLGNSQYEEVIENGVVTQKSYVGGVLVHTKTGGLERVWYLHRDHLGSVEAVTNDGGYRVERLAFAPYGQRRMEDWSDGATFSEITPRGFTDHEHLDDVNLIHMGGRVYDPTIGRFLSPDPFIQSPDNTQSFNRYSYVFNNPLSYVDPTGYECGYYNEALGTCPKTELSGGSRDSGLLPRDPFGDLRWPTGGGSNAIGNYYAIIATNAVEAAQRNATLPSQGFSPDDIPCLDCSYTPITPTPMLERIGDGLWHLMQGIPVEGQVITGVKATILLGVAKAGKFTGPLNRVAFGLSRHPGHSRAGILGRFAEHVNAKTYWDLYSNTSDLRLLGSRVLDMMSTSRSIHFNLVPQPINLFTHNEISYEPVLC